MLVLHEITACEGICTITIGNFDGLHLGHKEVLQAASQSGHPLLAITFSNHPSTVLHPKNPVPLILTRTHKTMLLEEAGIDVLLEIPFTKEFSLQSASEFLTSLHKKIPFKRLVLGHDATLGHDKQGDKKTICALAEDLAFEVAYVEEVMVEGNPLSSSRIRKLIQQGELKKASDLLGRPYSILGKVEHGIGLGGKLGAHTANLDVTNLATPPFGVWAIEARCGTDVFAAVANLGIAPTVRREEKVWLEVHVIDKNVQLEGKLLEVFFLRYMRPEKKFSSLDLLRAQIKDDIREARHFFSRNNA